MTTSHRKKWRCTECEAIVLDDEIDTQPNPFPHAEKYAADTVDLCLHCHSVWGSTPELLCDRDDCREPYNTCWVENDVARFACCKHRDNR